MFEKHFDGIANICIQIMICYPNFIYWVFFPLLNTSFISVLCLSSLLLVTSMFVLCVCFDCPLDVYVHYYLLLIKGLLVLRFRRGQNLLLMLQKLTLCSI